MGFDGDTILVTGGTGFIGTHVVDTILAAGGHVKVLDLHGSRSPRQGVSYILGDVRNRELVADALRGCSGVFHLAAAHHDSGISEANYFSVNVDGSRSVLDACALNANVRKVCFYSSVAVYGDKSEFQDESSALLPVSPYGRSKLEAEKLFSDFSAKQQRPVLVIRPTVTFGEGNFANMYSLIRQIESGRFVQVGGGKNIKSIGYVKNLIELTSFLWSRDFEGVVAANWAEPMEWSSERISNEIASRLGRSLPSVRIPVGFALTLASGVEAFARIVGISTPITRDRVFKLAVSQTAFRATVAKSLGFVPPYAVGEAFDRTVQWYKAEGRSMSAERRIPPEWPEGQP